MGSIVIASFKLEDYLMCCDKILPCLVSSLQVDHFRSSFSFAYANTLP